MSEPERFEKKGRIFEKTVCGTVPKIGTGTPIVTNTEDGQYEVSQYKFVGMTEEHKKLREEKLAKDRAGVEARKVARTEAKEKNEAEKQVKRKTRLKETEERQQKKLAEEKSKLERMRKKVQEKEKQLEKALGE